MSKFLILLLLLSSEFDFGKFQQVDLVKNVIKLISKFNTASDTQNNIGAVFTAIVSETSEESKQIQRSLNVINDKLTYMDNFITNKLQDVQNDIRSLPVKGKIQQLEDKFSHHIQTVDLAVNDISETSKQTEDVSDSRLRALVENNYDKVLESVEDIQKHLAPSDGRGEAKGLAEWYERLTRENILHRCGTGTSPQQLLLGLYVDVMKIETKAMEALIFLTSLQKLEDHVWETLTKQFVWRYNAYVESFTRAFDKASREHRSCDPNAEIGWKRGTTFFELERFNQATTFHRSGSYFRRARWSSCSDWFETVLAKQRFPNAGCGGETSEACWWTPIEICRGTLHICLSPTAITTCVNKRGSSRRYLWMNNIADEQFYGNPDLECSGEGRRLFKGFGDTCVCHCVEGHNRISLDLSLSDIEENRVITAMRLSRMDDIVFIQIKQGTLQPDGRIAAESTSWEPSSPSKASDKLFVLNASGQGINLDDLQGADDEVLTGIGFARANGASKKRVQLQIRVTKFDYTVGQLDDESRVISASDEHRTREKLEIGNPVTNLLENVATTSTRDTKKKFINFERSSLTSDAGQTTLPLFDAIPVEGQPPSPLGGAGLLHKKATNFGGFLSLRAIGINIAKYFKDSVKTIPASMFATAGKSFKNIIKDLLSEL